MFSKKACQLGGWARCRQHAAARRVDPTNGERMVREIVARLGYHAEYEYEITHDDGRPQFLDLYIPDLKLAIEVDGSHGFHGYNGSDDYGKMAMLDEIKARWCADHGIHLMKVNTSDRGYQCPDLEKHIQSIASALRSNGQG